MRDMVLVLDFDHQTSRTVARILRAERVNCKIVPGSLPAGSVFAYDPQGIVLAGAPGVGDACDAALLESTTPVLAIGGMACTVVKALGGEIGQVEIQHELSSIHWQECPLFAGLEDTERMLRHVLGWDMPAILTPIMLAQGQAVGYMHMSRPFFGLQMQLEQNAPEDAQILRNFALEICGCAPAWSEHAFIENAVEEIRAVVGEKKALCCVTGGLDSALCAMLAHRALGDRLQCLFVDAGFLREGEAQRFLTMCEEQMGLSVHCVQAQELFMEALRGIADRREKKEAFLRTMQTVIAQQAAALGGFEYFIKGTNCGDKLFSRQTGESLAVQGLQVLEPLQDLFKQEIKQVALHAGMPEEIAQQQPFPAGGLAQRIMGCVNREKLEVLRFADHVFTGEIRQAGVAKRLFQYYAMLLSADEAAAGYTIVLRAAQSGESAVSAAARLPYDVMENAMERILREKKQVAHVVYDLTPGNYYSDVEW